MHAWLFAVTKQSSSDKVHVDHPLFSSLLVWNQGRGWPGASRVWTPQPRPKWSVRFC